MKRVCVLGILIVIALILAGCPAPVGGGEADEPVDAEPEPEPKSEPEVVGIDPVPRSDDPVTGEDSRSYQLTLDSVPASDVYYRVVGTLPVWIIVDETTGKVTVDAEAYSGTGTWAGTVSFYASTNSDLADDASGGASIDQPFDVTFYIDTPEPEPISEPEVVGIDPVPRSDDPVTGEDPRSYQLTLDSVPAGDVYYRVVGTLPLWITVVETTGEVTVDAGAYSGTGTWAGTVSFYASTNSDSADDASGGASIDQPFDVTFYIDKPVVGNE